MPSSTVSQTIAIVIIDVCLIVGDKVSLCGLMWLKTPCIDQPDLKPRDLLASIS